MCAGTFRFWRPSVEERRRRLKRTLCYITLHYIILYCIVLYCIVLYIGTLSYVVSHHYREFQKLMGRQLVPSSAWERNTQSWQGTRRFIILTYTSVFFFYSATLFLHCFILLLLLILPSVLIQLLSPYSTSLCPYLSFLRITCLLLLFLLFRAFVYPRHFSCSVLLFFI
jgi:hypothetical protein